MLTRSEFELIADIVKGIGDKRARRAAALEFARRLALVNPRFDRERFLVAAGYHS
jgi:hypothetical protein